MQNNPFSKNDAFVIKKNGDAFKTTAFRKELKVYNNRSHGFSLEDLDLLQDYCIVMGYNMVEYPNSVRILNPANHLWGFVRKIKKLVQDEVHFIPLEATGETTIDKRIHITFDVVYGYWTKKKYNAKHNINAELILFQQMHKRNVNKLLLTLGCRILDLDPMLYSQTDPDARFAIQ